VGYMPRTRLQTQPSSPQCSGTAVPSKVLRSSGLPDEFPLAVCVTLGGNFHRWTVSDYDFVRNVTSYPCGLTVFDFFDTPFSKKSKLLSQIKILRNCKDRPTIVSPIRLPSYRVSLSNSHSHCNDGRTLCTCRTTPITRQYRIQV